MARFLSTLLILALLGGCLWLLGFLAYLSQFPPALPLNAAPRAEAVVILTGGPGRLAQGLKLLELDKAGRLFVSGVHPDSAKDEVFAFQSRRLNEAYARLRGRISLGRDALDTAGNARETAEWMRQNQYDSLLLVTSQYHMPRSLLELRRTLPEAEITPVPVLSGRFQNRYWWLNRETLRILIGEYHKCAASIALHFAARN